MFNCITGFYKPTEGRIALQRGDRRRGDGLDALTASSAAQPSRADGGALFLLERMPDYLDRAEGARRAHLPEHPAVLAA